VLRQLPKLSTADFFGNLKLVDNNPTFLKSTFCGVEFDFVLGDFIFGYGNACMSFCLVLGGAAWVVAAVGLGSFFLRPNTAQWS